VDKKTEKVLDSILNVLIAIVGEILTNQKKEEKKKDNDEGGWIVNTFLDNFFKVIFSILYRCLIAE